MMSIPIGRRNRLMRWMAQWLMCLSLACASSTALAAPFVSYDFSSNDGGEPMVGSLFFSAGMPVIDNCCNWISYQPSAVVSLTMGDQTWTNAATPGGYCEVWFHVGWIQVTVWCNRVDQDVDTMYRIDFWSAFGSNQSFDPDPKGPFAPETLRDDPPLGRLSTRAVMGDWTARGLSLDEVRITPYISEPSLPALLVVGAVAGWLTRKRRRLGTAN